MLLPFVKMQAVGNDFVVVAESEWPPNTNWTQAAVRLCDRKFGVGSDGLLLVGLSAVADLRMRMFNPDGTEDMCGNGLRCVVRRAFDSGVIGDSARIETLAGVRGAVVHSDGSITTEMGLPKFALADIPVAETAVPDDQHSVLPNQEIRVSRENAFVLVDAVSTGSTHAVVWKNAPPSDQEFFQWSPLIETDTKVFPERTSVMWAVVESPNILRLRIWERGAGETLGCGTGACAAAVLARQSGRLTAERVTVHSKGGTLNVRWAGGDEDPMFLTGTAHTVYAGEVDYPDA